MDDFLSEVWQRARGILGAVAPAFATAIGGPLAGQAVAAIGAALGLSGDDREGIAAAIVGATPEQLLALRKADADFKIEMGKLGVELERVAADDRKSARDREASVKDATPRVLAIAVMVTFLGYAIWATHLDPTAGTINLVIGWLGGMATSVMVYYFGSSAGSADKSAQLDRLTQSLATGAAAATVTATIAEALPPAKPG